MTVVGRWRKPAGRLLRRFAASGLWFTVLRPVAGRSCARRGRGGVPIAALAAACSPNAWRPGRSRCWPRSPSASAWRRSADPGRRPPSGNAPQDRQFHYLLESGAGAGQKAPFVSSSVVLIGNVALWRESVASAARWTMVLAAFLVPSFLTRALKCSRPCSAPSPTTSPSTSAPPTPSSTCGAKASS